MNDPMHSPLYEGPTAADMIRSTFRTFEDREAIVGGGERWTYAELAAHCHRFVRYFQSIGLKPRDRLVVLSANRPDSVAVQIAAHFMGLIHTPLHPLGSLEDQLFVLRDVQADVLVVDPARHGDRGRDLNAGNTARHVLTLGAADFGVDILAASEGLDGSETELGARPQDVLRIVYSGGTTGRSKGIVLRHRTFVTTTIQQMAVWEWPSRIRYLATTPISHAGGALVMSTFMRGGTVFLMEKYSPEECLALIERESINTVFMVPTQIYGLLDSSAIDRYAASSLELVVYGAAPMAPARLKQALERFGPVFAQVYAQAEAPMTVCYLRREEHDLSKPHRLASCGRPVPGTQVSLLDPDLRAVPVGEVGEVCVRGPVVMDGYLDRPEESAKVFAGDWLHTGDMGRMDADGFIYLVDRAKDMIISGGFNVYSTEVEACLAQHPAVAQTAVIGIPHEKWGEAVLGIVVLHPGKQVDAQTLMAYVAERKGAVIAPKAVEFVDSLPQTAVGKVDKKVLRARYWEGQVRQIG